MSMTNAARFVNFLNITQDDPELHDLIWDEFAPVISFSLETPSFPNIRIIVFSDTSAIFENATKIITVDNKHEFISAAEEFFHNNTKELKQFFDESTFCDN